MLKARDIMTTEPITVTPETDILQAANLLLGKRINGVPVVDENNKIVGIICQSDLIAQQKKLPIPSFFSLMEGYITMPSLKHIEKEAQKITAATVSQAMTADPETISPDTNIEEIAILMVDKSFHTLPVVEKGKLIGIVGKEDLLRTLMAQHQ
ncbi:MAG: CBS domain-containing protein [Desulfobacterales bacterium]|nr:CBS domain-containing protein [Desulfobacterales bacterium]